MIRDKFVFGLNDDNLKELLRETNISLDKLVTLAQRTKSSRQQVKEMTTNHVKATDAISENKLKEFLCGQCVHKHKPRECPGYGQQCSACHKIASFCEKCVITSNLPMPTRMTKSSMANVAIKFKRKSTCSLPR